ncbi:MAG: siroheme synthase [Deltaproteobacteria bacterium]|nr:MAG: siroheme synthase [Deltaproteobacteria bacterium]
MIVDDGGSGLHGIILQPFSSLLSSLVMRYYPLLLDLHAKHCLVIGAGKVGLRKIRTLLKARPGKLVVLDTAPISSELTRIAAAMPQLVLLHRAFQEEDLNGMHLVFACTSTRSLNAAIAKACTERGILCNITDDPQAGDVVLPSIIERGDLLITLSTSGASPALCKRIRHELDTQFGEEYTILLQLLRRIRELLLPLGQPSDTNAQCFRSLTRSSLLTAIRDQDTTAITHILTDLLPPELHPSITPIMYDLMTPH